MGRFPSPILLMFAAAAAPAAAAPVWTAPVRAAPLWAAGQSPSSGQNQGSIQDPGPIETRNFRSLSMPFLRIDPRPDVLTKGERTYSLGLTADNDIRFIYDKKVLVLHEDYEMERVLNRYRQGLGHGLDFTVDVPILVRWGGILDPIIDAWHQVVLNGGLRTAERNGVPYGQCVIQVPGSGPYRSAGGIGDVSAWLTKAITPRLEGTVALKLPTGNAGQILGSGAVDTAFGLQYHAPLGRWLDFYGQVGVVGQGASTELKSTRGLVDQEAIVFTWHPNRRDQFVFQIQNEASATATGLPTSDVAQRIGSFGYHRVLNRRQTLELFFSEDGDWLVIPVDHPLLGVGPDFTLGVRVITRF